MMASVENAMDGEDCPFGVDASTWKMCQGVECKDYDLVSISIKLRLAKCTAEEVVKCLELSIDELQSAKCDESSDEFCEYHWALIKWLEESKRQAKWCSLLSRLSKLKNVELMKSICDLIRQPQESSTGDKAVVAMPETNQSFRAQRAYSGGLAAIYPYEDTDNLVASAETSIEEYDRIVTGKERTNHNLASPGSHDINVKSNMRKLQRKFASLLSKTYKACHAKGISVSDFRVFINQLCADEQEKIPLFEQRMMEIVSHTSVEQTFLLLSRIGAWDFLNFHLVDEIMDECSLDEIRGDMISYKENVEEFKENTKLADFLHFWDGRSKEDSVPDCKAVIVKLQNNAEWSKIKLADVSHTEQHLIGEFHLKPYIMRLANGLEGSVYIMWLVPVSAARKMEEQMEAGLPNLAKLGIQELVIGRKIFKVFGFQKIYHDSLTKSAVFWAAQAKGYLKWDKLFERVDESDINEGIVRWFTGGKLNVSVNCLDRHVDSNPDSIAIIWEQDEQGKHECITYKMLLEMTCKVANVLKDKGVKKGERVIIYLPAMPLAIASMLACARIGAVHCVLFSSLDYQALGKRITDTGTKIIITANVRVVCGKDIPLKTNVDKALEECQHQVEHVLVAKRKRCDDDAELSAFPRYTDLDKAMEKMPSTCEPVSMNSNDDLFVTYTSGTTGSASEPKGIVSTQAGYLLYAAITHKFVFDHKPGDVMGCMADLGWIAGQTFVVYGPLCNGGTAILFESTACYPDCWRYWEMTQRLKITQMFITPYVVKSLMKGQATEKKKEFDTSSLRIIANGGEPLQTFVLNWFQTRLGKDRCTVIDTWWQTETGSVALVTWYPPKVKSCKPPSHYPTTLKSFAFFGVEPVLLKQEDKKGRLCLKRITPGMGKAIQSSSMVSARSFKQSYFSEHPGHYYTYDLAELDHDSAAWHILGRVDDAVRIKGIWANTPYIESVMEQADQRVQETLLIEYKCSDKQKQPTSCAFVGVTSKILSQEKEQESLLDQMKRELSNKEIVPPQKFIFTEAHSLPKTLSGKNIRTALKKIAYEEFCKSNTSVIGLSSEEMENYKSQYAHSNLAPTPFVH